MSTRERKACVMPHLAYRLLLVRETNDGCEEFPAESLSHEYPTMEEAERAAAGLFFDEVCENPERRGVTEVYILHVKAVVRENMLHREDLV